MLVAAARGIRGTVEVRDAGLRVDLTDASTAIHRLPIRDALRLNPLATHLAGTTSLGEVEGITREHCGFCEIDYERAKQGRTESSLKLSSCPDLDSAIQAFEYDAINRGIDYVTFRRMAEAVSPARVDVSKMRRYLLATRADHYDWPLWSLSGQTQRARAG